MGDPLPASEPKKKKSVALSGVLVGNSEVCTVGHSGNDLHYRGYDITDFNSFTVIPLYFVLQVQNRVAFGKPIVSYSSIQQDIAKSRIEIEQCRLLVLKAAHMMDTVGNKVGNTKIRGSFSHLLIPS